MVIIALPSLGDGGLNAGFSGRFGRCQSFTFVDVEDGEIKSVKAVPNAAATAIGGAGVQAAQLVASNNATFVVAGFLGPNASTSLNSLGLKVLGLKNPGNALTNKDVVNKYINGELIELSNANVGTHAGMGGGGRGMGGGGGRGMGGGGMGRGR